MPDLLIELFSEEIPARMQRRAAEDLRKLVTDALVERGFLYEGAKSYATPRRLALHVAGLPLKGQDVREERKGPRVGAPEAALQGFLKSAGVESKEQVKVQSDPKKGDFYVALIERPGRPTAEALAEILPGVVRAFPWPKSMRWGAASAEPGSLRWVRPLHSIVCTFGPETEDPEVVRFEVDGVASGDETRGHRFMAPEAFRVKRLDDYATSLERAKVVLDADRRKDIILHDARDLAFAQGLELVEDEALLEEVAGLVEWPVVLMGSFDESFLEIPAEVIRATIRANQKCFVLRRPDGGLSNRFVLVSNIQASDGGRAVVAGNERVVRARLSDALYFWRTDQRPLPDFQGEADKPLDQRLAKLRSLGIVFHEKLGTQGERVERITALAREIAPLVGADPDLAARAAQLAKADLVTEVVGEFPETQGLMGRRYAELQGEHPSVAAAIEDHYKPLGPSDRVPTDPVAVAVALADKIDTLVGFWAIDEKPTGSKDPYALRRAALGVIRLVLENGVRLPLLQPFGAALGRVGAGGEGVAPDLLSFFADRLKVYLRDKGARHDLIDAVLAGASPSPRASGGEGLGVGGVSPRPDGSGQGDTSVGATSSITRQVGSPPTPSPSPPQAGGSSPDDLLMVVRRVEALGRFLDTEDGRNLLAGYKRAANILRIEEKKDGTVYDGAPDLQLIQDAGLIEEKALVVALNQATQEARAAVAAEDLEGAMRALSRLRAPVDAFFDKVTVNAEDPALRRNRLHLLNALRAATREVADFDRIGA